MAQIEREVLQKMVERLQDQIGDWESMRSRIDERRLRRQVETQRFNALGLLIARGQTELAALQARIDAL